MLVVAWVRVLFLINLILSTNVSTNSVFANFGESCVPLPIDVSDNYLSLNTAYGYLVNQIDMKTYVKGACDVDEVKFKFCLKNGAQIGKVCDVIELKEGDKATLMSLSAANPALGGNKLLQDIILMVERIGENRLCLMMPTSRGKMPLACKSIKNQKPIVVTNSESDAGVIGQACYSGHSKSQSLVNFSGMAVLCLKETLDRVFYQPVNFTPNNPNQDNQIPVTMLTSFSKFQEALKQAIRAAFILYAIFYGMKVVLNYQYLDLNHVALFIIKFLLIAYFAVGLGPVFFNQSGKRTQHNGMVEIALPFLSQVTSDMAQMVFSAGGSKGLCEFDQNKYQRGYEFYAVWDQIDCRIGYYLGMQLLYNIGDMFKNLNSSVSNSSSSNNSNSPINLGPSSNNGLMALGIAGAFPLFTVLFGFLMAGNVFIVAAGVVFAVIFISLALNFITSYLVCLVTLYLMAYISPIFISMALFERTKNYFDQWLKVTLSCALQPAVIAGFIALILTMYDSAIYGNCEFKRHDYNVGDVNFSTFELREPVIDPQECRNSAGYKLLKYYTGQGWDEVLLLLFPVKFVQDTFDLLINLLYVLVFSIIFYFFSKFVNQFASDLTSGPLMDAVVASPTKIVDAAVNGAKFLNDLKKSQQNLTKEPGKDQTKDKSSEDDGKNDSEGKGEGDSGGSSASEQGGANGGSIQGGSDQGGGGSSSGAITSGAGGGVG